MAVRGEIVPITQHWQQLALYVIVEAHRPPSYIDVYLQTLVIFLLLQLNVKRSRMIQTTIIQETIAETYAMMQDVGWR